MALTSCSSEVKYVASPNSPTNASSSLGWLCAFQYRNRERAPTASHPEGWQFFNDAFLFDLAALAWIPLVCKGTPPHPRAAHR